MKLVLVPQPVLTQTSKPVLHFDKKLAQIIKEMKVLLERQNDPPGVGLAAPQVGLSLQLFIIKPSKKDSIETFVNPAIIGQKPKTSKPVIKKRSKDKGIQLEGCLSIPKIWGEVIRIPKVLMTYQTGTGEKKTEWFSGFKSVIIQHEVDHLNGILFTQRAIEQKGSLYQEKDDELEKIKHLI